ncbi:hypothetical protein Tco_0274027 [Tanacetum coccineum]
MPGHKCEGQLFTLEIRGEDEEVFEDCLGEERNEMIEYVLPEEISHHTPHISLNSLSGIPTHNTMRVRGHALNQFVDHELSRSMELQALLEEYADVFEEPKTLPSHRSFDHQIPLKEGDVNAKLRLYRYPPAQNDVIEIMVKELLDSRVIRPSHSPFSCPIVMVNKKDGSWRMCIDYRQLNKFNMKDKFPILVIEELIDELQGAQVFSK